MKEKLNRVYSYILNSRTTKPLCFGILLTVIVISSWIDLFISQIILTLGVAVLFALERKWLFTQRNIKIVSLILLFLSYEFFSFYMSIYTANSFWYIQHISFLLLLFVFCLGLVSSPCNILGLLYAILILSLASGLYHIVFYFSYMLPAKNIGFDNFFDIKASMMPAGIFINIWASIIYLQLPISVYVAYDQKKHTVWRIIALINIILIHVGILATFSRGAYIALFLFWILFVIHLIFIERAKSLKIVLYSIGICVSLMFTALPFYREVLITLKYSSKTSQNLSVEGRKNSWTKSLKSMEKYGLIGVGSYNLPLIYNEIRGKSETETYINFINNSYLQLLIEKGIIGTLVYILFGVILTIEVFRRKILQTDILSQFIAFAFLGFAIKEATCDSILNFTIIGAFFIFLLALIARPRIVKESKFLYYSAVPLIIFLMIQIFVLFQFDGVIKAKNVVS